MGHNIVIVTIFQQISPTAAAGLNLNRTELRLIWWWCGRGNDFCPNIDLTNALKHISSGSTVVVKVETSYELFNLFFCLVLSRCVCDAEDQLSFNKLPLRPFALPDGKA